MAAGPAERHIRVLFVLEGFVPELTGGMQTHAHALAEQLIDRGCTVEVLTRRIRPEAPAHDMVGRVEVFRLGRGGLLKGKGLAAARPLVAFGMLCAGWLRRHAGRYDVVLVHGVKVLPAVVWFATRRLGKALVVKPESPIELQEAISAESLALMRWPLAARFVAAMAAVRDWHIRRADVCIAISRELERGLAGVGVAPRRIAPVPNGIDMQRFAPAGEARKRALRLRLGLPADGVIAVYAGRFATTKGLLTLTEAWCGALAMTGAADHHLLLLGEGAGSFDDCEPELRRRQRERPDLARTLILHGPTDDVPAYLQAADLFLFPSDYEGFGLSLVEAMACGLPVVTTPVGVAAELVEDRAHGRVVPVRDRAALEEAIAWMLRARPDWPQFGAAAREAVRQRYGLEAVAEQYRRLFAGLLQPGWDAAVGPPGDRAKAPKALRPVL